MSSRQSLREDGNAGTPSLWSIINLLMSAEKREIEKFISRSRRKSSTVEQAFEHLLEHVRASSNNGGTVVHICVSLLEHIVKSPENTTRRKALLILHWLFQSDEAWLPLVKSLVCIIKGSEFDRPVKLGVCLVIKDVLLNNSVLKTKPVEELTFRMHQSIPIFGTCVPHLVELARCASVNDGGETRPTRLSISAADCVLVITNILAEGARDKGRSLPGGSHESWDDMLWNQLEHIIAMVSELHEWYKCARMLHARGLMYVEKYLRGIQDSCAEGNRATASLVLQTCWPEFAGLVLSEADIPSLASEKLQTLCSALQHFGENSDRRLMRRYILTCLALLLGRVDDIRFGWLIANHVHELIFKQLLHDDEDTVDIAIAILKFLILQSSGVQLALEPLIMELLNEREIPSKAVASFAAEYIAQPDLPAVFDMLDSSAPARRRTAADVITKLMDLSSSPSLSHNLALHLLERLGDQELMNASTTTLQFFARLDPAFVMPALIQRLYDSKEEVRSTASNALVRILERHADELDVVSILLDCSRNLSLLLQPPKSPGQIGNCCSKQPDLSRIMCLAPAWASMVTDWPKMIGWLLDKMFNDPSNPILPRFLSELTDVLDGAYQVLFLRIRLEMIKFESDRPEKAGDSQELFTKLSPLLVLRVLSLRAYDHLDCETLYGNLQDIGQGASLAELLVQWMCSNVVHDDVRKLSAELSGGLRPEVLMPLLATQLAEATNTGSLLKARTCVYALCTSLMLRGYQTLANPMMKEIRTQLTRIIHWDTVSEDVQKAQHGCIDCFALMIRAEMDRASAVSIRPPQASSDTLNRPHDESILQGVLSCLQNDAHAVSCGMSLSEMPCLDEDVARTRFRVCMANVLISSSSKIPVTSHERFLCKVFPVMFTLLQTDQESIVRLACIQLLFSSVYHFKATPVVSRYSNKLLEAALQALTRSALPEEMLSGAKLLASLLVKERILEEISSSLLNIRQVLCTVSRMNISEELRKLCDQLLCTFGV